MKKSKFTDSQIIEAIKRGGPRCALLLIALLCLAGVTAALVSQHVFDMPPCAWCVMQRLIYLLIAAFALTGAALPSRGPRLAMLSACLLLGIAGVTAAWYQHTVAAQMFSCDQTFADRFMTASGLESSLPFLFGIYATCMDAAVTVLGIEYAIWSLMLFALLAAFSLINVIKLLTKCHT